MKNIPLFILICFSATFQLWAADADYSLLSPDKTIEVKVTVNNYIQYAVYLDGKELVGPSTLAMTVNDNEILGQDPKVSKVARNTVNQTLEPVVKQKEKTIRDQYNELSIRFNNNFTVIFRAYNTGVAYRFQTRFKNDLKVMAEQVNLKFPDGSYIYFPEEESFFSHNERHYFYKPLDSITTAQMCSLPALVDTRDGNKIAITESALEDYPGLWLKGSGGEALTGTFAKYPLKAAMKNGSDRDMPVTEYADYMAQTKGSRSFPWRILAITRNDGELITNQLPYLLAEPSRLNDVSWIKPGKVAWDWWNFNNIYGVDFKAGVNTQTYKYYIDFASKYGLEYIILDEGWYKLGNLMEVVPDIDMDELIAYGKQKNVGIILWVVWKTLDDQLQEAMDQFAAWGIKGIKVDFMQRDDQWMVNYYYRIARETAQRKMLVDFHGAHKPSGLQRTYPNVISFEGVKGMENDKWSRDITPEHDVTIPFIRMLAGPMDFTPGAMINAQPESFYPVFNRPMSMGTRCHQMAMYVVYESPLQMLADNPSNYMKEPVCTEFIARVPSVWDETKVLDAKVADFVLVARKSGDQWFVGAMTDGEARTLTVDFSFLEDGTYEMEMFQDGMNANRFGSDYKKVEKNITHTDTMEIQLAPGGGWAARIRKK